MGHLMTHKMRHDGIDVVQNPLVRPQSKEDEMGTGGSVRQIDDTFSSLRNGPKGKYWTLTRALKKYWTLTLDIGHWTLTLKMTTDVHWFKALHSEFSN